MSVAFNRRSNISVSSSPKAAGGTPNGGSVKFEAAAKQSICLVSVCDQAYAEVADANKQAYCDKHGYTYRSFRASLDTSRHIAWSKVIAVLQLLPEFTWVMQSPHVESAALVVPELVAPAASDATRLPVLVAMQPGGAITPQWQSVGPQSSRAKVAHARAFYRWTDADSLIMDMEQSLERWTATDKAIVICQEANDNFTLNTGQFSTQREASIGHAEGSTSARPTRRASRRSSTSRTS